MQPGHNWTWLCIKASLGTTVLDVHTQLKQSPTESFPTTYKPDRQHSFPSGFHPLQRCFHIHSASVQKLYKLPLLLSSIAAVWHAKPQQDIHKQHLLKSMSFCTYRMVHISTSVYPEQKNQVITSLKCNLNVFTFKGWGWWCTIFF